MKFKLVADFKPTGDQPQAIKELVDGVNSNVKNQTLLGVTGSGKTFTIANVIKETNRPTLILSHNKTLAAQLYSEFKSFFPENAVEYFVSYYDYYQPEAYMPTSDTFIEKDMSINDEIEKLRLSCSSALLSGRKDVIVVSSVSCIYGIGNPEEFKNGVTFIHKGENVGRNKFLHKLVEILYSRTTGDFIRGTFRVKGDTVDIYLAYVDMACRIEFWGDEIENISTFDPLTNEVYATFDEYSIYPANIFVTSNDNVQKAAFEIAEDMVKQVDYMKSIGKHLEAKRLQSRVELDLEMMRELGYCSGIENYSRYFDGRKEGSRPFCLLDYFPEDFLMVIDESHVTVSQIKAMYGGDRARKINLVEYGFRLPSAMDNRPLKFEEFEQIIDQTIFVSATPADYELELSEGIYVEQLIRPTGLLDPIIEVRPSLNQIDDLIGEINTVVERDERVLVTTLTKRMAEEVDAYFAKLGIRSRYIHSDVDTMERVEILGDLRNGLFDVLIGVNLLREGLDLPEVSLVAILDADKEGFLRSERALVQTVGRAARNLNGLVIMYADRMTNSMQKTIDETSRRRSKQIAYNEAHNQVPKALGKSKSNILRSHNIHPTEVPYVVDHEVGIAADPVVAYMGRDELEKAIDSIKSKMAFEAKKENFMAAAQLRDEMFALKKLLIERFED
jgi:excinuclease ABC subunit B